MTKQKNKAKERRLQKYAGAHHENQSWRSVREYGTLLKQMPDLQVAANKAEKEYKKAVGNLENLRKEAQQVRQRILDFDEVLVTSKVDVEILVKLKEDHQFSGGALIAREHAKMLGTMVRKLKDARIPIGYVDG